MIELTLFISALSKAMALSVWASCERFFHLCSFKGDGALRLGKL